MSVLFWVHAIAMGAAWLILAPIGVQVSRFGRMSANRISAVTVTLALPAFFESTHVDSSRGALNMCVANADSPLLPTVQGQSPTAMWFQWHRALQLLTSALVVVGIVMAVAAVGSDGMKHLGSTHTVIGTTTIVLLLVQITSALLRPAHESSWRRSWEVFHKGNGYAMWVLAIVSCILGEEHSVC